MKNFSAKIYKKIKSKDSSAKKNNFIKKLKKRILLPKNRMLEEIKANQKKKFPQKNKFLKRRQISLQYFFQPL